MVYVLSNSSPVANTCSIGALSYRFATNGLQNCRYGVVRQGIYFVIRTVLNGVRHVDRWGIASDGFGLIHCGFHELTRGNKHSGKTSAFQISDVVHTARCARTSICQSFDHRMALSTDGLLKFDWGRTRKSRFCIAFHFQSLLS
jgi:hypothetical protein